MSKADEWFEEYKRNIAIKYPPPRPEVVRLLEIFAMQLMGTWGQRSWAERVSLVDESMRLRADIFADTLV